MNCGQQFGQQMAFGNGFLLQAILACNSPCVDLQHYNSTPQTKISTVKSFDSTADMAQMVGVEPTRQSPVLKHFECSLLRPLEYICIFNFVARNFPQGVISSAPSYDHLGNAPQHKFCTAYYNSLRGKCQFFAGGKMSGGKMSVGCICNERLRFLHDVLQGRQVVQNVAGFQGMIGVLIKTERRAVGAGCGGDGGSIAPGVGGA